MTWLLFALTAGVIVVAGVSLAKYGDALGEASRLGRSWIGVVLVAATTSLPELVTGVSATALTPLPDIAVGDVLGSCMFNLLILSLMDAVQPERISARAHQGHPLTTEEPRRLVEPRPDGHGQRRRAHRVGPVAGREVKRVVARRDVRVLRCAAAACGDPAGPRLLEADDAILPSTRIMRIVAVSDLHGFLPEIPECDLLIVAGDVCPDRVGPYWAVRDPERQQEWFDQRVRPWAARAPATHKILTWGNHDWCGQACAFDSGRVSAHGTSELEIVVDRAVTVTVGGESIAVWASPWSNRFMHWAFMAEPDQLGALYARIPSGIDVLVSHQPPYGCGDASPDFRTGGVEHLGSRELLAAIERVRPTLVVCGHIHEGHGRYDCDGIPVYNVSVVDEQYRLVHPPTAIDLPLGPTRAVR